MRAALPVLALGALSLPIYLVGFALLPGAHPSTTYLALYYPLAAIHLAAAAWVWRRPGLSLFPILAFAGLFRLAAAFDPPSLSSDIHRYAWDGRVERAGISPYAYAPDADALAPLRDTLVHPRINRPSSRTVYPPGAQALFALLPYDVTAIRWIMGALDLVTVALLARLLARAGVDPARVVLYAWSPFVVYEVGNNGHIEAAMLPLLVGAVLALHAERHRLTGVLWGLAVAIKLYPLAAGVILARRRPGPVVAVALTMLTALYAVFSWPVGARVLGFLPEYVGSAEDHNIGLRALIQALLPAWIGDARSVAFATCALLFAAGCAWIWRRHPTPERGLGTLTLLYLLTLPTALHPWYALWLVPWLCFHPRPAALWLLLALPLSYLKYATIDDVMPAWVVPVEIVPVALLLALEAGGRALTAKTHPAIGRRRP